MLPYRTKTLREWLALRGIGQLEVKKRGVPIDPETVHNELSGSCTGSVKATVILMRIGGRMMAMMARRITKADDENSVA